MWADHYLNLIFSILRTDEEAFKDLTEASFVINDDVGNLDKLSPWMAFGEYVKMVSKPYCPISYKEFLKSNTKLYENNRVISCLESICDELSLDDDEAKRVEFSVVTLINMFEKEFIEPLMVDEDGIRPDKTRLYMQLQDGKLIILVV